MKYIVGLFTLVLIIVVTHYEFALDDKDFEIRCLKENYTKSTSFWENRLSIAVREIKALHMQIKDFGKVKAVITWYHPDSGGINTDGDPKHTATMTTPIAGRTIALSTALVKLGWLGKRIYIEGHGVFMAEDRMNTSIAGYRIDICAPDEAVAFSNGKVHNVPCYALIN